MGSNRKGASWQRKTSKQNYEQRTFKRKGRYAHDKDASRSDSKCGGPSERRQSGQRQFCGTRSKRRGTPRHIRTNIWRYRERRQDGPVRKPSGSRLAGFTPASRSILPVEKLIQFFDAEVKKEFLQNKLRSHRIIV